MSIMLNLCVVIYSYGDLSSINLGIIFNCCSEKSKIGKTSQLITIKLMI